MVWYFFSSSPTRESQELDLLILCTNTRIQSLSLVTQEFKLY